MRARSRRTASRMTRSTDRRWRSSLMSMKSLTMTPPRSRRRICREIFFSGLHVDLVGRFFGIVIGSVIPTIHIDGDQSSV